MYQNFLHQLEVLKNEVKKRKLEEKFVFTGFIKHGEMPKLISAADVGIAPYKLNKEMERYGFYFSPIKIFEYMACGKPVVASDLDIIRDVISANKCGLLARLGNAEDFASKIEVLLRDEKMRERMGENGRRAVLKYTWDSVADKILSDCHG